MKTLIWKKTLMYSLELLLFFIWQGPRISLISILFGYRVFIKDCDE